MSDTRLFALVVFLGCFSWASAASAEPVATVGDRKIERTAVEKAVAGKLLEVEKSRYEALKEGIDMLVAEALFEIEAAARGITVEKLVENEILAKAADPSEEEIQELYNQAQPNLNGAPIEKVRDRLVDYLTQVKLASRQEDLIDELRKKHKTVVTLRPPSIQVETGSRVRGPADAKVTIVEFSDYECPFCKRAEASVQQVLETYGDKVRLAYRDYPLEFHARARPAAEAAHCANAQGKFWDYHDKIMASDDLSKEALVAVADAVGIDRAQFDKCVAQSQFKGAVEADIEAGDEAGVNGTPAFFINGRMIDGAQPFEAFKEIIDEELAWAESSQG